MRVSYGKFFMVVFTGLLFSAPVMAASQNRAVVRNMVYGGVESRTSVQYQPEFQQSFYIGLNGALNLATFSNDYSFKVAPDTESDSYSFVKQFGFGLNAGYEFTPKWRAELEYGYSGKFEDQDSIASFSISSQYLMANALYTFAKINTANFYGGLGLGVALLETQMSGAAFETDGKDKQDKFVFASQVMLGIEQFLTENFAIGAEYRLMYNGGMTNERQDVINDTLVTKTGGILTNSLRLGIKYKF